MKRIEAFQVGQKAELKHTVTSADVHAFVSLTGDDNPLHTDPDFAASTPMKDVVAHGMLGASFISTIIGKHLPGEGALWVSQDTRFVAPVRLGDELTVTAEVTSLHVKQSLMNLSVTIKNQRGKVVITAECAVKVLEPQPPTEPRKPATKTALVTGGSSGIGAATVQALGKRGFHVIVHYNRNESAAQRLVEELRAAGGQAHAVQADLSATDAVSRLAQEAAALGPISTLVHCASPRITELPFEECSWATVQQELDVQVGACYRLVQALLPSFEAAGGGSIVVLGSVATQTEPPPNWIPYNFAKSGLQAFARMMAGILGPKNIRINTVSPGLTDTRLIADVPERERILTKMRTPLRKIATPEEVANAIAFLASDEASHVTGQNLTVDGGRTLS